MTARAAGTPLGTGSFSAASPVQGGCSGWPCTRSGGSRCPPQCPTQPGIAAGSPSRAARGYQGLGDSAMPAPGCGSSLGRGFSAQPWGPVPCHSCVRASQRWHCQASAAPFIHQRPPAGNVPRVGDREVTGPSRGTGGFFLPLPQHPKAAPGRGDAGPCQRSCPTLLRVGEAELRQEC